MMHLNHDTANTPSATPPRTLLHATHRQRDIILILLEQAHRVASRSLRGPDAAQQHKPINELQHRRLQHRKWRLFVIMLLRYSIPIASCLDLHSSFSTSATAKTSSSAASVTTHLYFNDAYAYADTIWCVQYRRVQRVHFLFRRTDMRQHILLLQQPVRDQLRVLHLQRRWHLVRNVHIFTHVFTHHIICNPHQARCWSRRRSHRRHVHLKPQEQ